MAGFVLGTGSGVLAAAMVYYTLSTSLSRSTAQLQADLHASSHLLDTSFDPQPLSAPSASIGPAYPSRPTFSQVLQQRWNLALSRGVDVLRETDYVALGGEAVHGVRAAVEKLSSGAATTSTAGTEGGGAGTLEKIKAVGKEVVGEMAAEARFLEGGLVGASPAVPAAAPAPAVASGAPEGVNLRKGQVGTVGGSRTAPLTRLV